MSKTSQKFDKTVSEFNKMVSDDVAKIQYQENLNRALKISAEKDEEIAKLKKEKDSWNKYQASMLDSLQSERIDLIGRLNRIEQRIHALGFEVPTHLPKLTMYPCNPNEPTGSIKLAAAFDEVVNQWKISKEE